MMLLVFNSFPIKFSFHLTLSGHIIHPKCGHLGSIKNGNHVILHSSKWPKSICRVQYSCDAGFLLMGEKELFCINGQWSDEPPSCEGMSSFPKCMYKSQH